MFSNLTLKLMAETFGERRARLLWPALVALPLLLTAPATAQQHCVVDPTGTYGGGGAVVPTIADALSGPCSGPSVQIDLYCPQGGGACPHDPAEIYGRFDVLIRSLELDGVGDPVILQGQGGRAVHVVASADVHFVGISEYDAPSAPAAIEVEESQNVSFTGVVDLDSSRYGLVRAPEFAFVARGGSTVELRGISLEKSGVGFLLESLGSGHPQVTATGLAIYDNDTMGLLTGGATTCPRGPGPRLEIRSDAGPSWLNYVMRNDDGIYLEGSSELAMDHGVLAGNLRLGTQFGNRYLLYLDDASRFEGRNLLLYDHDARRNPGDEIYPHWPPNTNGMFALHETCDQVSLTASSLVHDEGDVLFELRPGGSGKVDLDHVVIAFAQAKVISASSYWVIHGVCPPVTATGTVFWQNRVDMDPPGCLPGSILPIDPTLQPTPHADDTIAGYPVIPRPPDDLYLLDSYEPVHPYPLPAGLYDFGSWTVDSSTSETGTDLDVGHHNP